MKFKVGQKVYLPDTNSAHVIQAKVDAIMLSTDKDGIGGNYYYHDSNHWDTCYRLSNGLTVHESSLFGEPREAFDYIEQRAATTSA